MADHQQTQQKGRTAPDPDDPRKPDDPPDLHGPTLKYVLRRTLREFSKDQCTDLAAALVYFAVLALFPALIALVSLLGPVSNVAAHARASFPERTINNGPINTSLSNYG